MVILHVVRGLSLPDVRGNQAETMLRQPVERQAPSGPDARDPGKEEGQGLEMMGLTVKRNLSHRVYN